MIILIKIPEPYEKKRTLDTPMTLKSKHKINLPKQPENDVNKRKMTKNVTVYMLLGPALFSPSRHFILHNNLL